MTDKQLIQQLNKLKNIKPSQEWQKNSRSVLYNQINNSGGVNLSAWSNFWINFKSLTSLSYRPIAVMASFLIIILTASFFSHQWFQTSKPNESLYIARIISEKAKLNTVLNSASREKMAAFFAMSHAEDISDILADPNFDFVANQDKVVELNEDFNREIAAAKDRVIAWQNQNNNSDDNSEETSSLSPSEEDEENNEEEDLVFIADKQKDEQGLQVSVKDGVEQEEEIEETTTTSSSSASSSLELGSDLQLEIAEINDLILEDEVVNSSNLEELLNQAEKLFQEALEEEFKEDRELKFEEVKFKLKEAQELL
jgi:hypothetical protein